MTPSIPDPPDLRADAVRRMIARVQDEQMLIMTWLAGVELCVLGGPRHALFDQTMAQVWLGLRPRARQRLIDTHTRALVKRGLLLPEGAIHDTANVPAFALSPELGVILAARCRPGFIITIEASGTRIRQPAVFALGDETDPLRACVVETPIPAPDTPGVRAAARQLGPLAVGYAYALGTGEWTSGFLADWLIKPLPARPDLQSGAPRIVRRYHPADSGGRAGFALTVRTDGTTAHVDTGDGAAPRACDREGLHDMMRDLMAGKIQ
jgi:hypothetical protein